MRASASRARAPLARVARGQLEAFVRGRGRSRTLARGVASEDGRADAMTREGKIVSEATVHSRYVTVYDRVVEFEETRASSTSTSTSTSATRTRRFAYDVVGHPKNDFKFVVVAPFHSRETTTSGQPEFTIVREYAQGSNSECIVLPSGAFEKGKHETLRDVAAGELREEARVIGGTLIQMIDDDNPGLLETKWCLNRMFPFLSIDGERDDTVIERDAEEFNMTHERVTAKELKRHMYGGAMMMPSVVTAQMAIDHLLKSGHLTLDDF